MRVYNEVYCNNSYTTRVEEAILELARQHPEWELDLCTGDVNWEAADD